MPTVCPLTEYDPLGPQTEPRLLHHDIVCIHTMAGYFAGTDSMFHKNGYGGTESHFGVSETGYTKQWQDLDYQADANLDGNHRVISIETADMGPGFPNWIVNKLPIPPFTGPQLDKITAICDWLCTYYNIPRTLVPDTLPGRRGIAYHRQGIDPWRVPAGERWSDSPYKPCPGDARIDQVINVIIPRLNGEGDMPLDAEDLAKIKTTMRSVLDEGTAFGQVSWAGTSKDTLATGQTLHPKVNLINTKIDGLGVKIDGIAGTLSSLGPTLSAAIHESIEANLDTELDESVKAAISRGTEEGLRKVLGSLDNT